MIFAWLNQLRVPHGVIISTLGCVSLSQWFGFVAGAEDEFVGIREDGAVIYRESTGKLESSFLHAVGSFSDTPSMAVSLYRDALRGFLGPAGFVQIIHREKGVSLCQRSSSGLLSGEMSDSIDARLLLIGAASIQREDGRSKEFDEHLHAWQSIAVDAKRGLWGFDRPQETQLVRLVERVEGGNGYAEVEMLRHPLSGELVRHGRTSIVARGFTEQFSYWLDIPFGIYTRVNGKGQVEALGYLAGASVEGVPHQQGIWTFFYEGKAVAAASFRNSGMQEAAFLINGSWATGASVDPQMLQNVLQLVPRSTGASVLPGGDFGSGYPTSFWSDLDLSRPAENGQVPKEQGVK